MRMLLIALAITCTTACTAVGFPGVYRIDVEQGNIVTEEMVDQLQPGMSKRQVRFILGTPLVEDSFNRDRWDYLYNKRNGLEILAEQKTTIVFDGDALVDITGDYVPPAFGGSSEAAPEAEPGGELEAEFEAAAEAPADTTES